MYLQENTPEAAVMRQNVVNLVNSGETHNIELALQLMTGGGFVVETATKLWRLALEEKEMRKEIVKVFEKGLPKPVYQAIASSWKYNDSFYIFVLRYLDTLTQYEGFSWENIINDILPYAFKYEQEMMHKSKEFLLNHPDTPKYLLLKSMVVDGYNLSLSNVENITTLPAEIGKLQEITYLDISYTNINTVTDEFFALQNLESFYYQETPLAQNQDFDKRFKEHNVKVWAKIKYNSLGYNSECRKNNILEILEACPDCSEAAAGLIMHYHDNETSQKYQKMIQAYETYQAAILPNDTWALSKVAEAHIGLHEYEKALTYYQRILTIDESAEDTTNWYQLSKCYRLSKQYEAAIQAAEKAIQIDANDKSNYEVLYDAYREAGKHTEALQVCQTVLNIWQDDITFLKNMADTYQDLGEPEKVKHYYHMILTQTHTDDDDGLLIKAQLYREAKDFKKAIKCLKKVMNSYGKTEHARTDLGILYMEMGKYIEAEKLFHKNLTIEPYDTVNAYNIACAVARQGDKKNMLYYLKRAIEIDIENKYDAAKEEDFQAFREDPDFLALLD